MVGPREQSAQNVMGASLLDGFWTITRSILKLESRARYHFVANDQAHVECVGDALRIKALGARSKKLKLFGKMHDCTHHGGCCVLDIFVPETTKKFPN